MRARSARFHTFVFSVLAAVMALVAAAGPWTPLIRPAAAAGSPDLTIESITINPSDPAVGDAVTIIVYVKNIGSAPSPSCYVTAEVDGAIIDNQNIDGLQPGMTTTASFSWTATPGVHIIKATADSTDIVAESDETNNIATFTLQPRAPDLTITSITYSPQTPLLRQEVLFTIHIANIGTAPSGPNKVNFLVEGKSSGYQSVPSLAPGGTTDIIYPWYAEPGQFLMTAQVDADNQVQESNENNNQMSVTFNMPLPDLTVEQIYQDPVNYSSGDTVNLIAEIKNQGVGAADKSQVAFYINDALMTTKICPALEPGAAVNITAPWVAQNGNSTLKVIADYYHVVTESNENNNTATCQLGTVPPDLTVSDLTWTPTSISAGDTVNIQVTITNQGGGRAGASRAICQIGLASPQLFNIPPIGAGKSYTLIVPWLAIPGSWDVTFTANYDDNLLETTYSNNGATAKITVTPPDLTVSAIHWTPQHPDHGAQVSFNVTVTNQGAGTAPQSYLGYYIDGQLVSNTLVTSLAAGQSVNMTYTWVAQSGYHTFTATADYKKEVAETNETNNSRTVSIVANMPDLVIGSVTWSPPDLPVGQTATFTVKVSNIGTQSAPLTRLAYYVDGKMAGYVDVPPLAPGAAASESVTWPIASGEHTIKFVADATNLVQEIDEENNDKILTLPLPDLVVTSLSPSPAKPAIGETETLTVTLKNEGKSPTQAGVLSGRLDDGTAQTQPVGPIAPGASVNETFQWQATGGTHTFSVAADVTNTTIESDETNNFRSIQITSRAPDLTVGDLGWTMKNPLVSNTVNLTANITNAGNAAAPAAKLVYRIDGGQPVTGNVPALAAGESYTFTTSEDLAPQPHTFSVTVDPDNTIWESDETNNTANLTFNSKAPDLDIRAIGWTPTEAAMGDNITISVNVENRGTAPADGAKVTLSIDGKVVGTQTSGTIGIGESQTLTFPWKLTSDHPVITAMADEDNQIPESNETNNTLSRTADIIAPAPAVTTTPALPPVSQAPSGNFIQDYWWLIMVVAAAIGGGVFVMLLRAFRKE